MSANFDSFQKAYNYVVRAIFTETTLRQYLAKKGLSEDKINECVKKILSDKDVVEKIETLKSKQVVSVVKSEKLPHFIVQSLIETKNGDKIDMKKLFEYMKALLLKVYDKSKTVVVFANFSDKIKDCFDNKDIEVSKKDIMDVTSPPTEEEIIKTKVSDSILNAIEKQVNSYIQSKDFEEHVKKYIEEEKSRRLKYNAKLIAIIVALIIILAVVSAKLLGLSVTDIILFKISKIKDSLAKAPLVAKIVYFVFLAFAIVGIIKIGLSVYDIIKIYRTKPEDIIKQFRKKKEAQHSEQKEEKKKEAQK